jgi:hypothetical protein
LTRNVDQRAKAGRDPDRSRKQQTQLLKEIITGTYPPQQARASMRFNREFDSFEMHESDSQSAQHDEPSISTRLGITIDSIRINREFDSNEMDEKDLQY